MQINDKIKEIADNVQSRLEYIKTEEATKTSFVMPFISALGYDVFNPLEVIPEFTADVGTKKGEKVDYAIKKDGKIIMLVECKQCGLDLSMVHKDQLYRYFSVTESRFALLTNGTIYHFYSDIDAPNKMDEKPFFEFDITSYNDGHLEELSKFTKPFFELDKITSTASDLKYTNAVKKSFSEEVNAPSESFVKFFISKVYQGVKTHSVIDQFNKIVKNAVRGSISDLVSNRLQLALQEEKGSLDKEKNIQEQTANNTKEQENKYVIGREIDAYNIIKAIARSGVEAKRISLRHGKSQSSVVLDNSIRKPICKLYFHSKTKAYIGLIEGKEEKRVAIKSLDNIFDYADVIEKTPQNYIKEEPTAVSDNKVTSLQVDH